MSWEMISLAFVAGVMTFLNPCGFALLPAYIAHYLGQRDQGTPSNWVVNGWRGLKLGLVVSAGFFTVFGVLGVGFSLLGSAVLSWIGPYLPWVAASIGTILMVGGLLMLSGSFSLGLPLEAFAARITQGNPHHSLRSYYLYGMGYAIGSIGCVFPIFFMWAVQPLLQGFVGGLANFVAYASGMALMMVALSLMMSFSKGLIESYLRPLRRYVYKLAALVMIGAGAYLIYYSLIYSGVIRL
jgi:cytochrome c biogenesis protein CcdA